MKSKSIIIIVTVALLLLGGGGGTYYFLVLGKKDAVDTSGNSYGGENEGSKGYGGRDGNGEAYAGSALDGDTAHRSHGQLSKLKIEPFIVNLADPGSRRYLRLAMHLELWNLKRLLPRLPVFLCFFPHHRLRPCVIARAVFVSPRLLAQAVGFRHSGPISRDPGESQ